MEAFQMGLIDRTEALKKTDIFDKTGVIQRMDVINQLQQQIQGAQEQIKKLSGDLQTANRAEVQSRKRTEVEKFKSRLNEEQAKSSVDTKLSIGRLKDTVKLEEEKLRLNTKKQLTSES